MVGYPGLDWYFLDIGRDRGVVKEDVSWLLRDLGRQGADIVGGQYR